MGNRRIGTTLELQKAVIKSLNIALVVILVLIFFNSLQLVWFSFSAVEEKSQIWSDFLLNQIERTLKQLPADLSKRPSESVSSFRIRNNVITAANPSYLNDLNIESSSLVQSSEKLRTGETHLMFHPDLTNGRRNIFIIRRDNDSTFTAVSFEAPTFFPVPQLKNVIITASRTGFINYSTNINWVGNRFAEQRLLLIEEKLYITHSTPVIKMRDVTITAYQDITVSVVVLSFLLLLALFTAVTIALKNRKISMQITESTNETTQLKDIVSSIRTLPTFSHKPGSIITIQNLFTSIANQATEQIWQYQENREIASLFHDLTAEMGNLLKSIDQYSNDLEESLDDMAVMRNILQNVINSMPAVLIGYTHKGAVNLWNSMAEKLFDIPLSTAINKELDQLELLPLSLISDAQNTLKTGQEIEGEFDADVEEHKRIFRYSVFPLQETSGDYNMGVLMLFDITEEKLLQVKMNQSQKMEAVGQLAGGIAHDFNNMLGGIIGSVEVLEDTISDEQKEMFDIIMTASQSAAELTRKLLNFARKGKVESTPVDVHKSISEAIMLLSRSIDKSIEIKRSLKAKEFTVVGDPSQLQNMFLNLAINASHAMAEGGGSITFSTEMLELDDIYCSTSKFELEPGNYIQVAIEDTGTGIAPEHLQKIFDPFFTTKDEGKGTGLGLAGVLASCRQHKGAITVYSELGVGTKFAIYLPLSEKVISRVRSKSTEITGEGTILVIDDEQVIRAMAQKMLESLGYSVFIAAGCHEGFEIFKEKMDEIDIVLLDVIMPKTDGRVCFKQIKQHKSDAKVILTSGFSKDTDITSLLQEGLCGFIRKPYFKAELAEKVREVMKM